MRKITRPGNTNTWQTKVFSLAPPIKKKKTFKPQMQQIKSSTKKQEMPNFIKLTQKGKSKTH